MSKLLEIRNLQVEYGRVPVVEKVNFSIDSGDSVGLLGLNGAGKTTTVRAALGMIPYQGAVSLFGQCPSAGPLFKSLGYAPEEAMAPEYLNGLEYLLHVERLKGSTASEAGALLEWIELDPKKKIRNYSKGMHRRLLLAQALIGQPKLLILDEPLSGLDPIIILKLRERLERFVVEGGALLFSSHILAEVERICRRVCIMANGRVAMENTVEQVVNQYGSVEKAFAKVVSPS